MIIICGNFGSQQVLSFALGLPESTLVAVFLGDRSCGLNHVLKQGIRMARQISGYEIPAEDSD